MPTRPSCQAGLWMPNSLYYLHQHQGEKGQQVGEALESCGGTHICGLLTHSVAGVRDSAPCQCQLHQDLPIQKPKLVMQALPRWPNLQDHSHTRSLTMPRNGAQQAHEVCGHPATPCPVTISVLTKHCTV